MYQKNISTPLKQRNTIYNLLRDGKVRQGTIINKHIVKQLNDQQEQLNLLIEFENLEGTRVKKEFEIVDTQPYQNRYEKNNPIKLRLATTASTPSIILENTQVKFSPRLGILLIVLSIIYMLGTFIWHYHTFSNGNGWRFLSFWHPWLITPYSSLLMFGRVSLLLTSKKDDEQLILRGRQASATVIKFEQTGTYINEQPEIRFTLEFTDYKGKQHLISFTEIVLITDLYKNAEKTREILYLPEDPNIVVFV